MHGTLASRSSVFYLRSPSVTTGWICLVCRIGWCMWRMRKILVLVAMLMLGLGTDLTMAAASAEERTKKFAIGFDFLQQNKYQEARAAYEAGLQEYPANALAHFYLGDACRGLKAWASAEEHYATSLELDAKSSVAGLARQRLLKAKIWRMLGEGKLAISEPNAPPTKIAEAKDTLDIANKLGLDDEQQAFYQQVLVKLQQRHTQSHEKSGVGRASQVGRWLWCRRGSSRWGVRRAMRTNNRCTKSMWRPFSWISTKCRWGNMRGSWTPRPRTPRRTGAS